jgi:7-cyano-7-deazaguanine synthase in queuosine biosynthesis
LQNLIFGTHTLYKAKTDGRNRIVVGECMSDAAGYDRLKSAVRSGSRDLQKSVAA